MCSLFGRLSDFLIADPKAEIDQASPLIPKALPEPQFLEQRNAAQKPSSGSPQNQSQHEYEHEHDNRHDLPT